MLEPLPTIRPPQPAGYKLNRRLPATAAFGWLAHGWRDFMAAPGQSLAYGLFLTLVSYIVLGGLWLLELHYLVLPAISGFLIIGPYLTAGIYEQSRRLSAGKSAPLREMLFLRPASGGQLAYAGLLLGVLVLSWLRAADLLYALFFGLVPYPGVEDAMMNAFFTPRGWALLVTGTFVGGIFAAFAFALSLFSIPMLVTERTDALTAMGLSFSLTTHNLAPCLMWAAIIVAGMALSAITGLLALIIVFPVLGYGTWHCFCAIGAPDL